MHEDYVEMVRWNEKDKKRGKKIGLLITKLLEIEEKICVNLSTKIIVVVEEEAKRLVKMNVPLEKIEVISNTVDSEEICYSDNNVSSPLVGFEDKFILCYVGGFSKHRGLDTLVKAMPLILSKMPNTHLLLIGDGIMKNKLLELCKSLNIEEKVTFTGWIPLEEALDYIKISDICVIPYHKTKQTNKSFPHKLSQYMYLGKPILVSDVNSLKRIVEENRCGVVFKAGNPDDLARKIINAKYKGILSELGRKGRIAAITKYNWKITSQKLVALYNQLVKIISDKNGY